MQTKINRHTKVGVKYGLLQGLAMATVQITFNLVFLGSVFLLINWPELDVMQVERMFTAFFCIVFGLFASIQVLQSSKSNSWVDQNIKAVFSTIEEHSQIDPHALNEVEKRTIEQNEEVRGEIEFINVWFRHPACKHQEWTLKDFSLKVKHGEAVAVLGAGRTHLLDLLMRFYDADFGQILVNGVDIKEYNLLDLRGKLGLVMQEPAMLNYSIKDNLLYGNPRVSD